MPDPAYLAQLVVNGLVIGAIYALLAIGLSLIFGIMEVVNFAHGEFYMLGAMATYFLVAWLGLDYWLAVIAVLLLSLCAGFAFYWLLARAKSARGFEHSILLTLGLAMLLQNGALYLFTANPRLVTTSFSSSQLIVDGITVSWVRVSAFGLSAASFAGLYALLYLTRTGRAMRAVAENRQAALMVGIVPETLGRVAIMTGIALCGLAGAALSPVYVVQPLMGALFVFKAFAIVIIGGFGSIGGAVVAAMSLGLMESVISGYVSLVATDMTAFAIMIAVLLIRPLGLFGRGVRI